MAFFEVVRTLALTEERGRHSSAITPPRFFELATSLYIAIMFYGMGHEYMTDNHGLHPMLAGAAVMMFMAKPYIVANRRDL